MNRLFDVLTVLCGGLVIMLSWSIISIQAHRGQLHKRSKL